jgi:hypothetical protein
VRQRHDGRESSSNPVILGEYSLEMQLFLPPEKAELTM